MRFRLCLRRLLRIALDGLTSSAGTHLWNDTGIILASSKIARCRHAELADSTAG